MTNEENANLNYAQAILDGSSGKHKIYLLSIIGEVEGHENLSGNTKTTKYDQILPKLAELEEQFQDPAVATNSAKLGKLHSEQVEVQGKLDDLYEEWEALASD